MTLRARAKCPECGRVLAVQPPAGGDGSGDVYPRHGLNGQQCDGSRQLVYDDEYTVTV